MVAETPTDRLARLEERVRVLEAETTVARQRLHVLGNAVNPVSLLVPEVERHDTQLQELRSMLRAARWLVIVLAPLLAIATAATPLLVRYTVRDMLAHPNK